MWVAPLGVRALVRRVRAAAPELQPDVTADETATAHAGTVGANMGYEEKVPEGEPATESVPVDHSAWREVGWIFRNDDCIVIERRGEQTRSREMAG